MNTLHVFKIGGGIIEDQNLLKTFLADFAVFEGLKILVHGGGRGANQFMERLSINPKMVEGRRITDQETLQIVTMYYAGLLNTQITASLQGLGINAIGLSGADGNALVSEKRPAKDIDYGWVGDLRPSGVNVELIKNMLKEDLTPVFCAITHNAEGQLLNTNADTIAAQVALAMNYVFDVHLHFCLEHNGVLANMEDESSYFPRLTPESFQRLKIERIIDNGMIPKLENAFSVIENGVKTVVLEHARNVNNEAKTILCAE